MTHPGHMIEPILPPGEWVAWWSGETLVVKDGAPHIELRYPFWVDEAEIPIFARRGTVIPFGRPEAFSSTGVDDTRPKRIHRMEHQKQQLGFMLFGAHSSGTTIAVENLGRLKFGWGLGRTTTERPAEFHEKRPKESHSHSFLQLSLDLTDCRSLASLKDSGVSSISLGLVGLELLSGDEDNQWTFAVELDGVRFGPDSTTGVVAKDHVVSLLVNRDTSLWWTPSYEIIISLVGDELSRAKKIDVFFAILRDERLPRAAGPRTIAFSSRQRARRQLLLAKAQLEGLFPFVLQDQWHALLDLHNVLTGQLISNENSKNIALLFHAALKQLLEIPVFISHRLRAELLGRVLSVAGSSQRLFRRSGSLEAEEEEVWDDARNLVLSHEDQSFFASLWRWTDYEPSAWFNEHLASFIWVLFASPFASFVMEPLVRAFNESNYSLLGGVAAALLAVVLSSLWMVWTLVCGPGKHVMYNQWEEWRGTRGQGGLLVWRGGGCELCQRAVGDGSCQRRVGERDVSMSCGGGCGPRVGRSGDNDNELRSHRQVFTR